MPTQNTVDPTEPEPSSVAVKNDNDVVKGGNAGQLPTTTPTINLALDNDESVNVDTQQLNPISLKECCRQVLVQSCIVTKPPTLLSTCADYISWHSNETYKCSMILLRHMNTATYMMELLDHVPEHTLPHIIIKQVRLHDDLFIDPRVKDYLLQQAKSRKYEVVINKLTEQTASN